MKTQEQIIRNGKVANYDEFLTENSTGMALSTVYCDNCQVGHAGDHI